MPPVQQPPQDPGAFTGGTVAPTNPIGVPGDYVAVRDDPYTHRQRSMLPEGEGPRSLSSTRIRHTETPPRYVEGDDWAPASLSPEAIAQIQRQMIAVGLIPSDAKITLGFWDNTTREAYRDLLTYANASGLTWSQALKAYGAAGGHAGPGGPARQPLTIRTTNPDDLRRVFRAAVINELGQGWSQEEIDKMVASYQGQEASVQRQAYDAGETGGTVTDVASPQAYAEAEALKRDPSGVAEHNLIESGGPLDAFRQMLGGWA